MEIKPELQKQLVLLNEKYEAMGQDLMSYLEGLLHSDYLTYWDYIHLDTLLTLQTPRTPIPDEKIFIIYHQITELYFNLTLHELYQITDCKELTGEFLRKRVKRMSNYFRNLTMSFSIMGDGMEHEQFLKFRMALLPASGFQSMQYRTIEIVSTDLINLVEKDNRGEYATGTLQDKFERIYWKHGATELATGKRTLTLKQFLMKYTRELLEIAEKFEQKNLWQRYKGLPKDERNNPELIAAMREYDLAVNVNWPLVHYRSASRYLHKPEQDIAATGGTNWQKYLPPRFQKRIFFPELWTDEEKEAWGTFHDELPVNL